MKEIKIVLLIAIVLLFNLSCTSDSTIDDNNGNNDLNGTEFVNFELVDSESNSFLPFQVNDGELHIVVPPNSNIGSLIPKFKITGEKILVNEKELVSEVTPLDFSDFTNPICCKILSSDNKDKLWKINLYNIPVMLITTPDSVPITSKEDRINDCKVLLVQTDGTEIDLGIAGVRGRGNSTWLQPKKPYNVKLDKKHSICGMKESKHWILLANAYYDRTLLHNATAFEIARLTDFPWIQSGTFVELFLNGKHQGLYYLCENVRAEKGKIEIKEMSTSDVEGDFLLESTLSPNNTENSFATDYYNITGKGDALSSFGWEIKSPDNPTSSQSGYIKNTMNHLEEVISSDNCIKAGDYRSLFDIESAINWWLVEELTLNEEASRSKNMYLYNLDGKIYVGPCWDFDAWSFGLNGEVGTFYSKEEALYYHQLFKDPVFIERLKEKWKNYKPLWEKEIPQFIDSQYDAIHKAAERNEILWPDWHPVNSYPSKTYKQCVEEMKDAFVRQLNWMDYQINGF